MSLDNVLKDFLTDNMKKAGLYEYDYYFSVNFESIDADDILDNHKYSMKKRNIK